MATKAMPTNLHAVTLNRDHRDSGSRMYTNQRKKEKKNEEEKKRREESGDDKMEIEICIM